MQNQLSTLWRPGLELSVRYCFFSTSLFTVTGYLPKVWKGQSEERRGKSRNKKLIYGTRRINTNYFRLETSFSFSIFGYKKRLSSSLSQHLLIILVVLGLSDFWHPHVMFDILIHQILGRIKRERERRFTWARTWCSAQTVWTPEGFFRQRSSDSRKNYLDSRPQPLLTKKRKMGSPDAVFFAYLHLQR